MHFRNGFIPTFNFQITDGAIMGLQGGEEAVLEKIATLEASGVKVAAVWLQDWCGQRLQQLPTMTLYRYLFFIYSPSRLWWNWESDGERYPNWPSFVAKLRDRGIRVMSYINPMLSDTTTKPKTRTNYFKKALEEGVFVMNPENTGPELIESFAGLFGGQIDCKLFWFLFYNSDESSRGRSVQGNFKEGSDRERSFRIHGRLVFLFILTALAENTSASRRHSTIKRPAVHSRITTSIHTTGASSTEK
jgi:hypothetical protein